MSVVQYHLPRVTGVDETGWLVALSVPPRTHKVLDFTGHVHSVGVLHGEPDYLQFVGGE